MTTSKIFILDDDPEELAMIKEFVEKKGIDQISYFEEPEKLLLYLECLQDHELPNIIVSDLNMPRFTGVELIGVIRNNSRFNHIPIIIYSTSSFADDIDACLNAGAKEFLVKPNVMEGYEKLVDKLMLYQ